MYSYHHHRCWPTSIQYLYCQLIGLPHVSTHVHTMQVYPPNSGSMLGQPHRTSLVQCPPIVYVAGPTLIQHWVCCIFCAGTSANTCHSPNAVSMLNQSLRRWPNIEIAFGDCLLYVLPHSNAGDAFLPRRQKGHFPDNMIHWPYADVMLRHRLRRWADIIPTKTL